MPSRQIRRRKRRDASDCCNSERRGALFGCYCPLLTRVFGLCECRVRRARPTCSLRDRILPLDLCFNTGAMLQVCGKPSKNYRGPTGSQQMKKGCIVMSQPRKYQPRSDDGRTAIRGVHSTAAVVALRRHHRCPAALLLSSPPA